MEGISIDQPKTLKRYQNKMYNTLENKGFRGVVLMKFFVEIEYNKYNTLREFYTIMTQEEYIKQLENTI